MNVSFLGRDFGDKGWMVSRRTQEGFASRIQNSFHQKASSICSSVCTFIMLHRELSFLTLLVLLCQHGVKAVDLITCEGETASFTCAQGTINVLSANNGRTDRATCSTGRPAHQLSNVQCTQSTSLSVLTTQCDGKLNCSIVVGNSAFTEPCPGTYKYLNVSYECILPPPPSAPTTNLVTCESETAHLSCDQGTIKVLSANYGRTDSTTCSTGRPAHQLSNVQCTQSTSLSVLTTQCDGKQNCSIVVGNAAFTDPCPGTYKYLNVSYECILPPPPSAPTSNLVTCESETAHLSCDQGTIKVLSANYGRTDSTTCSTGRPAHQLSNVQCTQSTSLSVLTTQCDGKQNCSIVVGNAAFTDPCPGTYKYLNVSYECILPPPPSAPITNLVTCESETAHLSCDQGTIKVLSANYGRTNNTTCSTGRPANQLSNVQCTQSTSLSVVTTRCDGKQNCSIVVGNAAFTDPCPGTYKYLYVSYECILPPPPKLSELGWSNGRFSLEMELFA
ncbi:rhamnose-binding lectin-like [Triplophysa rosa]|uniref:rhamnose-binding lectin-like n=1 Tax=Triplophysa rosa TaxID=992332 RepID=UPI002545DBCE|nr:rhamnose-binding lectin-like [Triplophysa rosa]